MKRNRIVLLSYLVSLAGVPTTWGWAAPVAMSLDGVQPTSQVLAVQEPTVMPTLKVEKVWEKQVIGTIRQVFPGSIYPSAVATDQRVYFFDTKGLVEREISFEKFQHIQLIDEERYGVRGPAGVKEGAPMDESKLSIFNRSGTKLFEHDTLPFNLLFPRVGGVIALGSSGPDSGGLRIRFYNPQGDLIKKDEASFGRVYGALVPLEDAILIFLEKVESRRLIKMNLRGQVLWEKEFPQEGVRDGSPGFVFSSDGQYFALHLHHNVDLGGSTYLFKVNGTLLKSWSQPYAGKYFSPTESLLVLEKNLFFDFKKLVSVVQSLLSLKCYAALPSVTPDGKWLVGPNDSEQVGTLWVASRDGDTMKYMNLKSLLMPGMDFKGVKVAFSQDSQHLMIFGGTSLYVFQVTLP